MNYLAHLFLSQNQSEIVFSNFMTDMMTIQELRLLPKKFEKGILLHRQIDQFTDQHTINLKRLSQLYPFFGKYASVVLDVYYDYFLYKNWNLYSSLGFEQFAQNQYLFIQEHLLYVPKRLIKKVERMIDLDFLSSFQTIEGIGQTMARIDKRAHFTTGFDQAIPVLIQQEKDLNDDFNKFFPLLQAHCESFNNSDPSTSNV